MRKYIPAGAEDNYSDNEVDIYFSPIEKTCKNLKITVVPDITSKAGLNDENFDATLSKDTEEWFKNYRNNWNLYNNTPTMVETLKTLFLNCDNPLLLALKLFANCPGCSNVKNKSLPLLIFKTIRDVKEENPEILENCDENMKMVVFNFVKDQGQHILYKYVADAYDLRTNNKLFEEKIKSLILEHNYKNASQWAIILGLTEKFGLFEIVFPLILQDKIFLAEEYLDVEKSLQKPTLELLDSLLDKSSTVRAKCYYYIDMYHYTDVKTEKLQQKPLTKLIMRLAKKYGVSNELLPNVTRSKGFGYLQYLLYKRYVDKTLNNDSWRELVCDTIPHLCDKRDMQYDFITSIVYNFDYDEALYWTKHFEFKYEEYPSLLQDYIQKNNFEISDNSEENEKNKGNGKINLKKSKELYWNGDNHKEIKQKQSSKMQNQQKNSHFYILKLNMNQIKIVATKDDVNSMLNELQNESLIAFDSEWKPSFQFQATISLIQLAKRDKIYLIDAQSKSITNNLWFEIGKNIFNNMEIIKIGFALNQDLTMFQKCIPAMNIISTQTQNLSYIDLQELWKKLNNLPDFQFPYKSLNVNETLSNLVALCLGKKLDKSNQFSNWGKRPLRNDQIIYAALDSYCLLEIYEVIRKQLSLMKINIEQFVQSLNAELKIKFQKTKGKRRQKLQKNEVQNCEEFYDFDC